MRRARARAGLSIVEVLVALVLLAIGLLGVAGSSAIALRGVAGAARERRALQRGADRLAELRAEGCVAARGGSLTDRAAALTETWRVGPMATSAALVEVDVGWSAPAGPRAATLRSGILC